MLDLRHLLFFLLLDTTTWPEGFYKTGPVLPSVRPPHSLPVLPSVRKFYQNWFIFFQKNDAKNSQKAQNAWFIWTFSENQVISFVWNWCKRKILWFFKILQKLYDWEKSISQVITKNSLVFFNRQYFINRLISDFKFWNVGKHEW